jgi:purine-binding chemotaxis protein CheW
MSAITENISHENSVEETRVVDYKMITFSLGGKDYGIDIMRVKEISKAGKFTYVPNAPPFVRGVYNLRGDIISILDLRIMFNIQIDTPVEEKLENILILRLDDQTIGVIVDSIDRVVGIDSKHIQPPHPIFGDINIKYIKGVVEENQALFLILDVDTIFGVEIEQPEEKVEIAAPPEPKSEERERTEQKEQTELSLRFIEENLAAFTNFYVSDINRGWIHNRFEKWTSEKTAENKDLQLHNISDAEAFLQGFKSNFSGSFWNESYMRELSAVFPETSAGYITIWNPGCGKGFESYSLAVLLRQKFPDIQIKIWAVDNDLLGISTAPNLVFSNMDLPTVFSPYIVEGKNGFSFKSDIKDLVLFEYHDILHGNNPDDVDCILARDFLSYIDIPSQDKLLSEFHSRLRPGGILIIGDNELSPCGDDWEKIENNFVSVYRRLGI